MKIISTYTGTHFKLNGCPYPKQFSLRIGTSDKKLTLQNICDSNDVLFRNEDISNIEIDGNVFENVQDLFDNTDATIFFALTPTNESPNQGGKPRIDMIYDANTGGQVTELTTRLAIEGVNFGVSGEINIDADINYEIETWQDVQIVLNGLNLSEYANEAIGLYLVNDTEMDASAEIYVQQGQEQSNCEITAVIDANTGGQVTTDTTVIEIQGDGFSEEMGNVEFSLGLDCDIIEWHNNSIRALVNLSTPLHFNEIEVLVRVLTVNENNSEYFEFILHEN